MIALAPQSSRQKPPRSREASPLTSEFRKLCEQFLPPQLEDGAIVLIAGPAAGKGTQADILSAFWGIPTISIGTLLRERSEQGDKLGEHLKRVMKKGGLVRNSIVFELLENHLRKLGNPKTFILDGCPRARSQMAPLKRLLEARGIKNYSALYLDAKLATALQRSAIRRMKDEAVGKKARNDDKPPTVRKRYATFKRNTLPVTSVYDENGQLARANVNNQALRDNLRSVVQALGPVVRAWSKPELEDLRMPYHRAG